MLCQGQNRMRTALLVGALGVLVGCQGTASRRTPIHPNPNMDQVKRFDAQEPADFWSDGRSMRPRLEGTLAQGSLQEDDHLYRGTLADGSWAAGLPDGMNLDRALLARGQERYDIYCMPCHDQSGTGKGSVALATVDMAPPTFHEQKLRSYPIGQIYGTITNGVRTMPSYAMQIPVADRWAIATYVRAIQVAGHADAGQVPADVKRSKGWGQ
jgi:mono/diheme cytochrome c family protein